MQRKTFRLLLLATLFATEYGFLVSESAACPPGYRCPPGVACTGPGPGGCVPEGAPSPGERERPPGVSPEERARRAGERAKELLEGDKFSPDPVPPLPLPEGITPLEELIGRVGKGIRKRCEATVASGWFEPVQGVWQDDYTFADKPGKQLRPMIHSYPPAYIAELPMVKGRRSLLFGIRGVYAPDTDPLRYRIVIRGKSNGSVEVPVTMRFTLIQGGSGQVLWESGEVARVFLGGECDAENWKPFSAEIKAPDGIPPKGTFTFDQTGPYSIEAELVRADSGDPTGLKVIVLGTVVETRGPEVHFLPVLLSDAPPRGPHSGFGLTFKAHTLADRSETYIPDYYPLMPRGLPVRKRPLLDLTAAVRDREGDWVLWAGRVLAKAKHETVRRAIVTRLLADMLGTGGVLAGADRVVVVLRVPDYDTIIEDEVHDPGYLPAGMAETPKVIFVREDGSHFGVAHELGHTFPYLWSRDQMQSQCGLDYHGTDDQVAHGHRIVWGGVENRMRIPREIPVMGGYTPDRLDEFRWIAQCTYWNLVNELQKRHDPPLILVRGRLGRGDGRFIGQLFPAYQLTGEPDLAAGPAGDWAIVLRDARGRELGRFPFTPRWTLPTLPHHVERRVLSFLYRVPDLPGAAQIDLVGPGGVLDSKRYSAHAPTVQIKNPRPGAVVKIVEGKVSVEWSGADADGDRLLYTVLYSADGGKSWLDQAFERTGTALDVPVDEKGTDHRVKVLATDGARSAEAVVGFSLKR